MKRFIWEIILGLSLIALSLLWHSILYAIYRDINHIVLWFLTNLAFLPVSVLFVSLIIDRLMIVRDKHLKLEKLNMLIGTFFSSVGVKLLRQFFQWDSQKENISQHLMQKSEWSKKRFLELRHILQKHEYQLDIDKINLSELKIFLNPKMDCLLRLLENPHLFEHEAFTEALRSVFHLTEELNTRDSCENLPDSDRQHLVHDAKRAYASLAVHWVDYIEDLQKNYPYLFSLAIRLNPFDVNASVIIK